MYHFNKFIAAKYENMKYCKIFSNWIFKITIFSLSKICIYKVHLAGQSGIKYVKKSLEIFSLKCGQETE